MIDIDTLLATPLVHAWGSAAAPSVALAPLAELPPGDRGVVAALGAAADHEGRRWHLCGSVGGLMRKCGMAKERCEAVLREWLAPAGLTEAQIQHGLVHAVGAWSKPASEVSGVEALAQHIGAEHAALVQGAIIAMRMPPRATFAPVTEAPATPRLTSDVLDLDLNKQGVPERTCFNVLKCLAHWLGERVRLDVTRGRVVCAGIDDSLGNFPDGLWTDEHTTALMVLCEQHRLMAGADLVARAVKLHAKDHSFNPIQDWLLQAAAVWDGTPRVDGALARYWRAVDCAATTAVARVWLLSIAARGLDPGCKVDTCALFVGPQGVRKSTALEVLAGGPDWFADAPIPFGDKDAMQNIRGKLIWEISENASASTRDRNQVKAYLSQRFDTFRASYGHFSEDVSRTCTFVITSNDDDALTDPTGARRFLPVRIEHDIDIKSLREDREQLLGEAAARVLRGEEHWPSKAEVEALAPVHAEHTERDEWESELDRFFATNAGKPFRLGDAALSLGFTADRLDMRTQKRLAIALRKCGCEHRHTRHGKQWLAPGVVAEPAKVAGPKLGKFSRIVPR